MPKAVWKGTVIAESDRTVVVEGGYDVVADGEVNPGAAWYYPHPKEKAAHIKDHVAFWRGVRVVE